MTTRAPTLTLGPLQVWPPVVLAPMAGITNAPFRTLCRRHGGGLYVSEMVGARGLTEGNATSTLKASFAADESPRSIQLYGVSADDVSGAVDLLVDGRARGAGREDQPASGTERGNQPASGTERGNQPASGTERGNQPASGTERGNQPTSGTRRVDHIDLNFGCPAPKVTRHGGGAALPWRTDLYAGIVGAAVERAGDVPVTVKLRVGIDDDHVTYLEAGRIAADLGVAAVALHGRTAQQRYGPPADWSTIARLVEAIGDRVPVLGNGDIWEAADALRMVAATGCAGVVVGRGCLGRPWLFRDLQAAFAGEDVPPPPDLGEVVDLLAEHAELLVSHLGAEVGLRDLRKHTGWYLQGFPIGAALRRELNQVTSLDQVRTLLADVDRTVPFDEDVRRIPRGHTTAPKRVTLPYGWLESRTDDAPLAAAAATVVSGG